MFDDGDDFGSVGCGAEDAAVAGGVGGDGGEDGHGGVLAEVEVADGGDGFGADEGDVAGEDEEMLGRGAPESSKSALSICMAWPVPRCSGWRTNWTPV